MSDVTSITWGSCFKCGQPITGCFMLLGSERYHYGCVPVAVQSVEPTPCLSCHALQQHIAALEDAIRAGARDNTELSHKLARREERIVALESEVAALTEGLEGAHRSYKAQVAALEQENKVLRREAHYETTNPIVQSRIKALEQEVARLRAIVVEAIQWRLPEELVRRAKAALASPAPHVCDPNPIPGLEYTPLDACPTCGRAPLRVLPPRKPHIPDEMLADAPQVGEEGQHE